MAKYQVVFQVGTLYSSEDIQTSLHVGNAGGVRLSLDENGVVSRMVVMTSVPSARQLRENPYHDRVESGILIYTGAGREGDQSLAGFNKRIPQQMELDFPVYGFELIGSRRDKSIGPKRWRFLGLLEYLCHYPENQVDSNGAMRQVWLFEFRIHQHPIIVGVQNDISVSIQMLAASRKANYTNATDREIITESKISYNDAKETAIEIEALRGRLLAVSPQKFEHLIRQTLLQTGFDRVSITKYSQDGGIDVNAYAGKVMWPIQSLLVQIQAKRWLHSVGRREVAELRGSLQPFARGAVVTTSHFTKAAILEAAEVGKNPISLVNGYDLATIMKAIGLPLDQ